MRSWPLLAFFSTGALLIGQQKPSLTPAAFGKWETLAAGDLSPDGKWLAYSIRRVSDEELRIASVPGARKEIIAAFGLRPVFSDDSRFLAYAIGMSEAERDKLKKAKKPAEDKLGILNLASGETVVIEKIDGFAFSKGGRFLAMRKYAPERPSATPPSTDTASKDTPGATLVVRDLQTGTDTTFGNVASYAWSELGPYLAMTISADGKTGNGVQVFNPASSQLRVLDSGAAIYKGLAWRKDSDDLAVLKSKSDENFEDDTHILLAWKGLDRKYEFDPAATAGIPAGQRIVSFRPLSWSDDGSAIFFGIAEWERKPEKPASEKSAKDGDKNADDEQAEVDVWHTRDPHAIPEQKLRADRDRERNLLATWRLESSSVVVLGADLKEGITLVKGQKHAIVLDALPYQQQGMFGRRVEDLYVLDAVTGQRSKIEPALEYEMGASPDGRYVLYFRGDHYFTYDIQTGARADISKTIPTPLWNHEYDHPVKQKPPYGVAGWTKAGHSVLIYDEYDIWEVLPDGSKATRLTNGAPEQIRYRYVKLDPKEEFIDLEKPVYLSLYGQWTKRSGYARLTTSAAGHTVDRLLWVDKSASRLAKAKDAAVFAYVVEDFDVSPNYFTAAGDLKDPHQVTDTNPFQKDYAWGRSELIDYKNERGERSQAGLFYPANYEAGKKYPMIVYIYEIVSNVVHRYNVPSERAPYSPAVFTSKGYFVYEPDITYRPRDPGVSAVQSVVPAVKKIIDLGLVDAKRIGIVGHSWGAYQTCFLATNTNLFAAAVAGAPLTDLVSMYGSVYWNNGIPETGHYETGQERMEVPLWDDPQAYIRNSPVYGLPKMTAPLLVAFGDKDGAVDWHQGIEMYNMARRLGKDMVLLVYAGENHSLAKKPNQIDYHNRIVDWFDHYLAGAPAKDWMVKGQTYLEREKELKRLKKAPTTPVVATN
jgi:dipeptidyl aminopeptidase/acylaminoacyl peptidase